MTRVSSPLRRTSKHSLALLSLAVLATGATQAATSKACAGGGFSALGKHGNTKLTLSASQLPASFLVAGKYAEFEVDSATFTVRNYTLTGAPNPLDMTGGLRTPIYASKVPDLRGASLSGDLRLELKDGNITLQRGKDVKMKLTAKDCAQGGIFQMEAEREDGLTTLFTHTLANNAQNGNATPFYFDNRNFRNREGDVLPFGDTTITVAPRIDFGNDFSATFVGRDSAQLAVRRSEPTCANGIVNRFGQVVTVSHCGGVSRWDVTSGGRMGMVLGEDATEVSPSATDCAADCQAGNQIRGKATVLGFPFPVAAPDRLQPRLF